MRNKISVIVPMHNASNYIEQCLSSIQRQTKNDLEVILVDDCSLDNTIQKAQKFNFKIIRLKQCAGPAMARNFGAQNASGDILVFMDSDIILDPTSIENIVDGLSKQDTDIISGMYTENTPQINFFSQLQNLILVYRLLKLPEFVTFTNSAFCAVKRDAFDAVGGYDEKMIYYEDVDFGHRLTYQGYHCKLMPDLKVTHLKYFNHLSLLSDYFKKTSLAAAYKKKSHIKSTSIELPMSIKMAGLSTGFILLSSILIKISSIPFLFSISLYTISIIPLAIFLIKLRGLTFGLKSYIVFFEICLVSFLALLYGFFLKSKNV